MITAADCAKRDAELYTYREQAKIERWATVGIVLCALYLLYHIAAVACGWPVIYLD